MTANRQPLPTRAAFGRLRGVLRCTHAPALERHPPVKEVAAFVGLLAVQLVCAAFFLYDILASVFGLRQRPIAWALYELIQIGAAFGLVMGVGVTGWLVLRTLRARRKAEESLRLARGIFADMLDERFSGWRLTPAERDVALFLVKGMTTAEIAALRQTSEGTVKAQTAAIYRKAGVKGRTHLLSLFIEDLMDDTVFARAAP